VDTLSLNDNTLSMDDSSKHSEGFDEFDFWVPTVYDETATSSAEIECTDFSHDNDPTGTTLDTYLHEKPPSSLYSLPVEASRHWPSSSGHLQQVDTPSLNDKIFSTASGKLLFDSSKP
jgi:hypothetical protein